MPPGMETMMNNANKNNDTDGLKAEIADLKKQMADDKMNAQMEKMNEKMTALADENLSLRSQLAQANGGADIGSRAMPGLTQVGQPVALGSSSCGVSSISSASRVGAVSPFSGTGTGKV